MRNGEKGSEAVKRCRELLARYGYDVKPDMTPREQRRVIMAFQMHFRPTLYNGEADAETQAIAEALLEKYGQD